MSNWVTLDTEVLRNYFLVMFRKIITGEVIYFEKYEDGPLNITNILKILNKYTIVTFNGLKYDALVVEAACANFDNASIKRVGDACIGDKANGVKALRPWQVRKQFGFRELKFDHIDLIEVAPLTASLKLYAGRMHAKRMMDMPLDHTALITEEQLPSMRHYCEIDNENTGGLCQVLSEEIKLRIDMGKQYGLDLRCHSDAQIAEKVIDKELQANHGVKAAKVTIEAGTSFHYKAPPYLKFQTEKFQKVFDLFTGIPIFIDSAGYTDLDFDYHKNLNLTQEDYEQYWKDFPRKKRVDFAKWKKAQKKSKYKLEVNETTYTLGIGGIHSNEKAARHVAGEDYIVRDYDAEAFYPSIIVNDKLYPKHLGKAFLLVYKALIEKRLHSKGMLKKLNKELAEYHVHVVINASGKIVINGLFGKLGSKWSVIYSPDLMAQVTITGQLSFLMAIERLEAEGIQVISANTDGIVTKMHKDKEAIAERIIAGWEIDTGYTMEATDYESLNSQGVNSYVAVKKGEVNEEGEYSDGKYKVKGKGAFADSNDHYYLLRNNPSADICAEAVKIFLKLGRPVEETILKCKDIRKFVTVRTVNGGALKDGEFIGKVIRWYYGKGELDAIYYATSGNKVPKSDGGIPLMELPEEFPSDVDYAWYISEAEKMLKSVGYKESA